MDQKQISRPRRLRNRKKSSSYRCGDLKNVKIPPRSVFGRNIQICASEGGLKFGGLGSKSKNINFLGSKIIKYDIIYPFQIFPGPPDPIFNYFWGKTPKISNNRDTNHPENYPIGGPSSALLSVRARKFSRRALESDSEP